MMPVSLEGIKASKFSTKIPIMLNFSLNPRVHAFPNAVENQVVQPLNALQIHFLVKNACHDARWRG
jgi:hypothetical protein